jgi:3-dehydroquinate synthetase
MEITSRDKKSMNGQVQWILLERIGRAHIVGSPTIKPQLLRASLRAALKCSTG